MNMGQILLYLAVYFLALWLGFYLIARDIDKRPLRLAGLGLSFYAAAIMLEVLQSASPPLSQPIFTILSNLFIYLPALLWTGGLVTLLPDSYEHRDQIFRLWLRMVMPVTFIAVLTHALTGFPPILLAAIVTLPLAISYFLSLKVFLSSPQKPPLQLPLLSTLFFGLAVGLALPFNWLDRWIVILSIGLDLLLLGFGIAVFDAFDEGQRLREDMLRSFMTTFLFSLLFSIQIALTSTLDRGLTFGILVLLFSVLSTAIAIVTLSGLFRKVFANSGLLPGSQIQRAEFQAAARIIDRVNNNPEFSRMSPDEFQRLTRKAISYLGDLPRLAASPLTFLPVVTARLEERGARIDTLARANELKSVLTERIQRLKPREEADFGTSDAWRYYNSLHFPYVVGLKPYRRTSAAQTLADYERQALDWFRVEVPERTLYNWQTAAAELIAQDLLEELSLSDS